MNQSIGLYGCTEEGLGIPSCMDIPKRLVILASLKLQVGNHQYQDSDNLFSIEIIYARFVAKCT